MATPVELNSNKNQLISTIKGGILKPLGPLPVIPHRSGNQTPAEVSKRKCCTDKLRMGQHIHTTT